MPLTKEEQETLDRLTAKANEPDEEDFDIVLRDGKTGNEIRLPHSKALKLIKKMGFDVEDIQEQLSDDDSEGDNEEEELDEEEEEDSPKGKIRKARGTKEDGSEDLESEPPKRRGYWTK